MGFGRRKEKQDKSECTRCKGRFPETTYVHNYGYLCTECFGALILEKSQRNNEESPLVEEIPAPTKPEQMENPATQINKEIGADMKEEAASDSLSKVADEEGPLAIPEVTQENLDRREVEEDNCSQLMTRDVVWVKGNDEVKGARKVMIENGFSQLPVFDDELRPSHLLGLLTDKNVSDHRHDSMGLKVDRIMDGPPPTVPPTMGIRAIQELLNHGAGCVIVRDRKRVLGIITRENLM